MTNSSGDKVCGFMPEIKLQPLLQNLVIQSVVTLVNTVMNLQVP